MSTGKPMRPWGLGRASEDLPEVSLPYATTRLDPSTQLTRFYDEEQRIVDMSDARTFAALTVSQPGGSTKNAPNTEDDSSSDQK
ncbi:putative ATP-grasp-modified RiPP [Nonomuraea cavernae]|uniref:putative ATP-grasp-modified RiPP n=1 Tax=Nonomuraea cavernae TaxID=2045107 RepID=UPI0033C16099